MKNEITVPNSTPVKYKSKLINFIEHSGDAFGRLLYQPLRARIIDMKTYKTTYIVNLENGEICVHKRCNRMTPVGNLSTNGFLDSGSN